MAEIKQWITVKPNGKENKGQPIPVMEGQTKGEAVKSFVESKTGKEYRQNASYEEIIARTKEVENKFNDDIELNATFENEFFRNVFSKINLKYLPIKKLPKQLTIPEICNKVGGGDKTKGSCSSLALTYVANKFGFDVLDFRGGESCNFFATNKTIQEIAKLKGVKSFLTSNNNDFKAISELIKNVRENKDYILTTGRHTSIIKKENGSFYYLELQDAKTSNNVFKKLDNTVLKKRFKCVKSNSFAGTKISPVNILIDCDTLGRNKDFETMLGYINTKKEKQQKGPDGNVK